MRRQIAFLLDRNPAPLDHENRALLPAGFREAGWQVDTYDHEELNLIDGTTHLGERPCRTYDLLWSVGFGNRETYADRAQLLHHCGVRCVNTPQVQAFLHGKLMWHDLMPETHATADPAPLQKLLDGEQPWVLKPAAGSFGAHVRRVQAPADLDNLPTINGYWLMQRYSREIAAGEIRVLIMGDTIIGQYRRRAPSGQLVANLSQGGLAEPVSLQNAETELLTEVMRRLSNHGVAFAAIDLAPPYLVEVNVTNPGGLHTLATLHGRSFLPDLVTATEAWLTR